MQTTLAILETVLLVLVILVTLAVFTAAILAIFRLLRTKPGGKKHTKTELRIEHLDRQLSARVRAVQRSLLPEKERKKLAKEKNKDDKNEKAYESTVFVIDFQPSLRAREVETLRKEIDIIVQAASSKDEVVVRIDSPGGTVNGYGHAASQLLRVHDAGVPLTICVDEVAASGGYMCAGCCG